MAGRRLLRNRLGRGIDYHAGRGIGRVVIALNTRLRMRPVGVSLVPPARRRMELGQVCTVYTFVTDDGHYEAMLSSFAAAGLKPPVATFVRLTDATGDPFSAIRRLGTAPTPRYSILCHQDIRLDQGAGSDQLFTALAQLDEIDPDWVVAGNAGGTADMRIIRRLVDPYGGSTAETLPAQVVSLDENFLVFNPRQRPHCSAGLSGFHFYGSDVCLNAMSEGGAAYVIDFPLTHLSSGTFDETYVEMRERFLNEWNPRRLFFYLNTTTDLVFISRSAFLRRLFGSSRAIRWVRSAAPKSLFLRATEVR